MQVYSFDTFHIVKSCQNSQWFTSPTKKPKKKKKKRQYTLVVVVGDHDLSIRMFLSLTLAPISGRDFVKKRWLCMGAIFSFSLSELWIILISSNQEFHFLIYF